MRIGTWNLAGRWTDEPREMMEGINCDVWLLTEVSERLSVDGYDIDRSEAVMTEATLGRDPLATAYDAGPRSPPGQRDGTSR